MALFRGRRAREEDALTSLERLAGRLQETGALPLKRIPLEDLAGPARDIAELLNTRLDAVAAAEKEQSQFIADVSHELRTPLTVLRGSLEVALEEDRPSEEYREVIGNSLIEVRHLARLSQNLLFLARGQSGRVTLSFANVDLGKLLGEIVRNLQPAAADRSLELRLEAPVEPVRAFVDADRIQQVVHNLLENAMRYSEVGGTIRILLTSVPTEASLAVVDNGIGIPEADLPYVFERFFRSDRARRAYSGGSGLGLSIVRWIVEAHKGHVEVRSQPGVETAFTVRLPLIT